MKTTDQAHTETGPRRPRMARKVAIERAQTEYGRLLGLLPHAIPGARRAPPARRAPARGGKGTCERGSA